MKAEMVVEPRKDRRAGESEGREVRNRKGFLEIESVRSRRELNEDVGES